MIRTDAQVPVFDGEDNTAATAPTVTEPGKVFTQEEVNRILAADKRAHQVAVEAAKKQAQSAIAELNGLRGKTTLPDEERTALEQRIEQLANEMLTKEELAAQEHKKAKDKYSQDMASLTQEKDVWRERFTSETIARAIQDAAIKGDAYNPSQIELLLDRRTSLVEGLDANGRPNGKYQAKVRFEDTDKDGNPVLLELTPSETIKRMREIPSYQNLFKGLGVGGIGGNNQGTQGKIDIVELAKDPVKYRAWRAKNPLQ